MRKTKKIITDSISLEQAEAHFADFATTDAKINQLNAKMDVELTKIREKYQDKLAELGEQREAAFEQLQHFAITNPDYFVKKKSIDMAHGIIGFRTGTPSLKTLKGYTWAAVLNLVKNYLPDFVRTKEEVNKELILDRRDEQEVQGKLTQCGMKVEQSESFYVEPKKEVA
jgi:phage host-nuclease inhibitor protein Gam